MSEQIGRRVRSKTGRALVTGTGQFVDDRTPEDALHAVFVRSPVAHGVIETIDTDRATSIPGVVGVWTAADIADAVTAFGLFDPADEFPLARDRVRYVGDEIAIVLAETAAIASEAAAAVELEIDERAAVTTVEEALSEAATTIHPELANDPTCEVSGNVATTLRMIASGEAGTKADGDGDTITVSKRFQTHRTNPSPLEPHGCFAEWDPIEARVHVVSSTQRPHKLREDLAEAIVALEPGDIECEAADIGGGFGVKQEAFSHEICVTLLSMWTERPVQCVFNRTEALQAGRGRHPMRFDATLVVSEDGRMRKIEFDVVEDTGAYVSFGAKIAQSAMVTAAGPYRIPKQRATCRVVYTNTMPGTAVRGFGDPQFTFAREQLVDMAADRLEMDPVELRLLNVPHPTDLPTRTAAGLKWRDVDMPACLRAVKEAISVPEATGADHLTGVGYAGFLKRGGTKSQTNPVRESAVVTVDMTGTVTVYSGVTSIGQGTETGISQLVASTLGVDTDRVTPKLGDTTRITDSFGAQADRGAMVGGSAAVEAAEDLKSTLAETAASVLDTDPATLRFDEESVFSESNPSERLPFEAVVTEAIGQEAAALGVEDATAHELTGHGTFETGVAEVLDSETGTGNVAHAYTFGALAIAVSVDTGTGDVSITDIAIAEDAGRILNPLLVEGQVHGGLVHGIGETLYEEHSYDDSGDILTDSLSTYHLPTSADVPLIEKLTEVQTPDSETSHGQRGVGEGATVPVAGAIANAVTDATGVRIATSPLSAERVLMALLE